MSEVKDQVAPAEQPVVAEVKRNKRGVGSVRGAGRKKFDESDANRKLGLFQGHIESIETKEITFGEDTKLASFNGETGAKLVITFASNHPDANDRKYVTLEFMPVESNLETIPGGSKSWAVDGILNYLKHILDIFVLKGRNLTDDEANLLSLDFEDFNEDGSYKPCDSKEVLAGWQKLFTNFAAYMNTGNEGKSYFTLSNNSFVNIWMKLVRYFKTDKKGWVAVNRGDLAFTSFVGQGVLELVKKDTIPGLRLDPIRESITVKEEAPKAKSPNMGGVGVPAGMPMGASVVADPVGGYGDVYGTEDSAIYGDNPF